MWQELFFIDNRDEEEEVEGNKNERKHLIFGLHQHRLSSSIITFSLSLSTLSLASELLA